MSNKEIISMLEKSIGSDSIVEAWELPDAYVFVADTDETEFDPMMFRLGKKDAVSTAIDEYSIEVDMIANGKAKRIR